MLRTFLNRLTAGPQTAPSAPGWSTLSQNSRWSRIARMYIVVLMVTLLAMAILLLITADDNTELLEASVIGAISLLFPIVLFNSVPVFWVMVSQQGLMLQTKQSGYRKTSWAKVSSVHVLNTTMTGPFGPFYSAVDGQIMSSVERFTRHMRCPDWAICVVTEQWSVYVNGRDFDDPVDAGRVLASHLIRADAVQLSKVGD